MKTNDTGKLGDPSPISQKLRMVTGWEYNKVIDIVYSFFRIVRGTIQLNLINW